ncbi:glutamine amidotransferase (plasmid) [Pontibacillus sp. ALD_SL1]|uniref:type 1 glutamine amidotransferase n=1 Tax=Pontibacillus sp. ALD_SL1 TaxID=2777185 RepID=UPI001A95A5BD|nr:glutamine amidotransferase [Pontibacillus sp. ALD_SL1]QST02665.1 glutamine amidotransferase [Pontibacillus sp. ALD_SL1]
MRYSLDLLHFFPDQLNLYGDGGNITIAKKRCEWRGIQFRLHQVERASDADLSNADLFFIGGASDREQALVTDELQKIRSDFKAAIEDGVGGLTVCGGYQFLGSYYQLYNGEKLEGLNLLDFHTVSRVPDATNVKKRLIGDLHVVNPLFGRMIGYENHGGETFHDYDVLGDVVKGYGNNKRDKKEGLHYKNLIGTYMHGPLFSKNPRICDHLILKAMERKYGVTSLEPLDDTFSKEASKRLWSRCIS